MAYEQREGDISVFLETDKRSERAPDWKGKALIDGKVYEVALWPKGDRGTMLAGQIKVAQPRQTQDEGESFRGGRDGGFSGRQTGSGRTPAPADLDDEIPF